MVLLKIKGGTVTRHLFKALVPKVRTIDACQFPNSSQPPKGVLPDLTKMVRRVTRSLPSRSDFYSASKIHIQIS